MADDTGFCGQFRFLAHLRHGCILRYRPGVVAGAGLSRSGSANRSAGDLYGVSEPVRPGARELRLVIDQVVNP